MLPYSRFYYHPCTALHLQSQCKDCQKALAVARAGQVRGPVLVRKLPGDIVITHYIPSWCVKIDGPFESQEAIRKIVTAFDRKKVKESVDNVRGRVIVMVYMVTRKWWDAVMKEI